MRRLVRQLVAAVALLGAVGASGLAAEPARLSRADERPLVWRSQAHMGTTVEFTIVTADRAAADRAIAQAGTEIERIERSMSEWRPDSDVSAINRAAGQRPVPVPAELLRLLQEAVRLGALTDGKFDPTFAGAGRFWDFRAGVIPDEATIRAAISRIDYRKLRLDADAGTAMLAETDMRIGLGGIAKGYAVDRAVQIIASHGFGEFAVNAGGDLYVRGDPRRKLWRIGIQHPRRERELIAVLPAANVAVATSGDYQRYFMRDGHRYAHILDPDTGWPATACRSVTVMAGRAYLADALATGVFVLGPERGLALVERLDATEALIVDASGALLESSGLDAPQGPAER